jgi:hypothetical protein
MSRTRLAVAVSALLLALACNAEPDAKPASNAKPDAGTADAGVSGTTTGTTGTTSTTSTTTGGAGESEDETEDEETGDPAAPIPDHFDEIGVAVCDQYVKDYLACIDASVPEAERATHRRTLADNHASWAQTMKGGESAATALAIGCRAAREQAKSATTKLGCAW